ncbi:MAG TPA: hypothetical protein VH143_04045 [Kofleriaceae bacterium]|jgi:hypothetical protein|nr:hypothetical protein [Kofleriaceae bacterium]
MIEGTLQALSGGLVVVILGHLAYELFGVPRTVVIASELVVCATCWLLIALISSADPVARGAQIGLAIDGLLALATSARIWRRPAPRLRSAYDVATLAVVVAAIAGLCVGGAFGYSIAGASLGLFLVRSSVRGLAWSRVEKRIRTQLTDASDWRERVSNADDADLVWSTGLWNGTRVWMRAEADAMVIRVAQGRWPAGVALVKSDRGELTGDDAFDSALRVRGDESLRRVLLSAEVRERLVAILAGGDVALEDQKLVVTIRDQRAVQPMLDRCVELTHLLPDLDGDVLERVFDNTAREPNVNVRADNYRWLVARDWHVLRVYRAASNDPDPQIAAWAREHAPDGVFR